MKFRKKPVVIDAVQWHGIVTDEMAELLGPAAIPHPTTEGLTQYRWRTFGRELHIITLEGQMHAFDGDWIIRGVKSELYPCKHDIFEQTYEFEPSGRETRDPKDVEIEILTISYATARTERSNMEKALEISARDLLSAERDIKINGETIETLERELVAAKQSIAEWMGTATRIQDSLAKSNSELNQANERLRRRGATDEQYAKATDTIARVRTFCTDTFAIARNAVSTYGVAGGSRQVSEALLADQIFMIVTDEKMAPWIQTLSEHDRDLVRRAGLLETEAQQTETIRTTLRQTFDTPAVREVLTGGLEDPLEAAYWNFDVRMGRQGGEYKLRPMSERDAFKAAARIYLQQTRVEGAPDELSGSEAVYGLLAWLTCRPEVATFSSKHNATEAADLAKLFVDANHLADCRPDWGKRLKHPLQILQTQNDRDRWDAEPPSKRAEKLRSGRDFAYMDMSDGELVNYCGDNAERWAHAFCNVARKLGVRKVAGDHMDLDVEDIDQEWVMGWFANAIETATTVREAKRQRIDVKIHPAPSFDPDRFAEVAAKHLSKTAGEITVGKIRTDKPPQLDLRPILVQFQKDIPHSPGVHFEPNGREKAMVKAIVDATNAALAELHKNSAPL